MITEEAARGLEDRFLSAFENAQHAYEDIVAAEAWLVLGYATFTEWWKAKVVPKMRALEMVPKKEVQTDANKRIIKDQAALPPAQRMRSPEVAELTGQSARTVRRQIATARSTSRPDGQEVDLEENDPDRRERSATSGIDWTQAENMAREKKSFAAIGKALGVNESTIRKDIGVRRARAESDPEFQVNEDMTIRHHDQTIACEVAPFGDYLRDLQSMLWRGTGGTIYTLAARDRRKLAGIIADAVKKDPKLVEELLAKLQTGE